MSDVSSRFVSVTDRFLNELGPVASDQVPKDSEGRYENLVKGLKHIQIKVSSSGRKQRHLEIDLVKVWPPEAFEEGAEFMESLCKSFENAHGNRLKTAFAETLLHLMYSVAKVL